MNDLQRAFIEAQSAKLATARSQLVNAVSITIRPVQTQDNRYRILVTLMRTDRPRYWNFLCHNCGSKVVELQSFEVYTLDDFYDPQNINNAAIGKNCPGNRASGKDLQKKCPYTYFFKVY